MSTIDTSTWNPDADLNVEIEGIPLNSDASIAQTWQALRILMAAVKGDGDAIKSMIDVMQGATASADGASGLVPKPEAGDQDRVLKGDGTWGAVAAASHMHGNITNDGKVGTASGKPLVTGTGGAVEAGSFGTTAGTVCEGNDFRLSNARTPTSHTHVGTEVTLTGYLKPSNVSAIAATDDANVAIGKLEKALDAKAADSAVMHLTGAETVIGPKTFGDEVIRRATSNTAIFFDSERATPANAWKLGTGIGASGKGGLYDRTRGIYLVECAPSIGTITIRAFSGAAPSGVKDLVLKADGSAIWNGQAIQTSSDERLKTPLLAVPDVVLDAWGDVNWGQFQFLEAISEKGGSARLHLGLIAQRVKEAFEARGLDACAYGILCHDSRPAMEEPAADGNGLVHRNAVDMWSIRYAEAMAMEAAFQRRRAARLEARVAALEVRYNG